MDHYVDPTKETFAAFRANNCEGPVHMLNLIRLHERAQYPDSRQASGADAYAAYGHHSAPVLARLGGRIVWRGSFEHRKAAVADSRLIRLAPAAHGDAFANP